MTICGMAPLLAETWSQASTVARVISVVFGPPDLTTLALPDLPALYVLLVEWDWRGRNAMEPMCVAQAAYGQSLHRPPESGSVT